MKTRLTLFVYVTALATVLNLMFYLSLIESQNVEDTVEQSEPMMQEMEIINAIYYYPVLTEIEQHLLVWKRYEEIET